MSNTITFPIKPEPRPITHARADRSEMIGVLTGALAVLATDKSRIGAAYREGLCKRIRSILDRERAR